VNGAIFLPIHRQPRLIQVIEFHRASPRLAAAALAAVTVIFGRGGGALAANGQPQTSAVGDVFVIDLENHNWTQPDGNVAAAPVNASVSGGTVSTGGIQQIYGNSAAPFINSLVTPGNPNAAQVSYSSNYYEVLADPSGYSAGIHPSEGNYVWQEAGSNDNVNNDNDPYGTSGNATVVQNYLNSHPSVSPQHLTGLMQSAGQQWKAYAEDSNLLTTTGANADNSNGTVTSTPAAPGNTTVPLTSFSGTSASYTNPYNGSHEYNFATKHVGPLFFADTNGGNNATTSNTEANHYSPLQQLQTDLNNSTVGQYNLITPDQYNDMHTGLSGGFTYNGIHYTGDAAQIAQGDNFLSIIVPEIEASAAYKNNGAIDIWTDETEVDSTGTNQNDYNHTLSDIIISPLAIGNAYQSSVIHSHSSDLATMQEIFGLTNTPAGLLNDAGAPTTNDLSDLFVAGAIADPSSVFSVYIFRGPSGNINAPASGNWSTNFNWGNGAAPTTSINKELDFLDSGSSGYTATDDFAGAFSLNALVLGNNTAHTDSIANGLGSSLTLAGATPTITQSGSGAFAINSPIALAANPVTVGGAGTGALLLSGAISGLNFGLTFNGLNATTLSGANTYTGATAIYSGKVILDYTSQNNGKISSTAALTLGSGTLQINGNATAGFTQSVAALNLSGGAATVSIASGQTNLSLGAITPAVGASVNFINNGSNTAITTTTGVERGNNFGTGILGAYAVYNGTTWATLASSSNSSIVGFTAFGSTSGSTGTIDSIRESVDITASDGSFSGNMETIRYNTANAVTTTIGSSNIDFTGTYGGVLMTPNVGTNNNLIQGNLIESGGDFYIHQFDTLGTLTISSQFTGVGTTSFNLIKDGPGTAFLNYAGTQTYNGDVYLNGGLLSTSFSGDLQGTLIFNGGGLQPTNNIAVSNAVVLNAAGGTIDVPAQSASTFSGNVSGVGPLIKTSAGSVTLSASNSYTGGTVVNAGLLTFAAPGAFPLTTDLTINGGACVAAAPSVAGANSLITSSLTIAVTGKLDLNNNDLLVQNGNLSKLFALVASGYNSGAQNGYGIFSTAAANDTTHLTTLGIIQNSVDGTVSGAMLYPTFDGFTDAANSDVLIKYTYFGDANLDGKVDGSDYSRIDNGYLNHLTGWYNGDFNYDGVVNGSDYTLIDNAFNTQGAILTSEFAQITTEFAPPIQISTVPEPATTGLLAIGTVLMLGRRHRSRSPVA
jgi:autotransporter-associated beta strand protein